MQETQEMWIWSLSHEDPLEKKMTTHASILARKVPWTEKPGGLNGVTEDSDMIECIHTHIPNKQLWQSGILCLDLNIIQVLLKWKSESEVAHSHLTVCNPMDCSLPGSSIHGISQARSCHFLLQGICWTQVLNPGVPHCRQTLYHLSHQTAPLSVGQVINKVC